MLLSIPLGIGGLAAATMDTLLVVEEARTGRRAYEIAVDQGDEVTIAYTHSVERTPVREVFVVEGTILHLRRMEFVSFGAGLPTEEVERTDAGFVVYPDRPFQVVELHPAEIPSHELVVGDRRYDLVDGVEAPVRLWLAEDGLRTRLAGPSPPEGAS